MNEQVREKRQRLAAIRQDMERINKAENFGEEEQRSWDALKTEKDRILAWLERNEEVEALPAIKPEPEQRNHAPAHHQRPTKDNVKSITARYIRTGDPFAAREMHEASLESYWNFDHVKDEDIRTTLREERASNDTSMNIATPADGGYLVPTGHYNQIIARAEEMSLSARLPIMPVPGVGTTVNVQVDNEADGEFISTAEQVDAHTNNFDRDAPAVNRVAMTLVKYTKKIELTDELMLDNDSNLMQWLEYRVGVGLAKTDNNLIVTEALANGTAALTLDGAAAITAAEVPELVYAQAEGYEDGSAWVMRKATHGHIRQKTGDVFQFAPTPAGASGNLWTYPLYTTSKVPAIGAGNKSMIFGNFRYMGVRRLPGLTVLRDPYTVDGMVVLKYYYRVVFKVLQAAAITYATHPTA